MIVVQGLCVEFPGENGKSTILENISFSMSGNSLGIIGPNGSGKSTLLKVMAGVISPSSGVVHIDGMSLLDGERRGRAYVPQVAAEGLWLDLTVRESLLLSASRGRLLWKGHQDFRYCQEEVPWLPPLLERRLDTRANNLSGGERQVLLLACALANSGFSAGTVCLFADEFTSALDPHHAIQARSALREAIASLSSQIGIVFVTHSFSELVDFATHVLALESGHVAWCRPINQVSIETFHSVYDPAFT